ncbi:hypothetical protein BDAP_002193 [Binucleata daphniae]
MINIKIINNFVCKNDILHVLIKNLGIVYYELLTAQIIGILESKEGEIKFLESIPIVLKVKDTLSKNIIVSILLPHDILPSYKSENYTIQYFFVLNSINKIYKKIEFRVYKAFDEFINYTNVRIIEQDYYHVMELNNVKDIKTDKEQKNNFTDKNQINDVAVKEKTLYDSTKQMVNQNKTSLDVLNTLIAETYVHNEIDFVMNEIVNNNKERYFRHQFYEMFNKSLENKTSKQKLQMMEHEVHKIDCTTQNIKYIKYKNNLQKLKKNINIKIDQKERVFSVKENENVLTEIKVGNIFFINKNNKIEIKYKDNVKTTKIIIKKVERKTGFSLDFENVIYEKEYVTDHCVSKTFDLFLDDAKYHTISCFYFIVSFTIIISLDDNQIELPIIINQSWDK